MSASSEPARLSDLFASAVHRFGAVWPDLLVVSVIGTVLAGLPAVILHANGRPATTVYVVTALAYGVAYFAFVGFVVLRGLPVAAPRAQVLGTYVTATVIGLVTGLLLLFLQPFVVIVIPFFLLAVPAVAAGDRSPAGGLRRGVHAGAFQLPAHLGGVAGDHGVLGAGDDLDVPGGVGVLRRHGGADPGAGLLGADRVAVLGALHPRPLRRPHRPPRPGRRVEPWSE